MLKRRRFKPLQPFSERLAAFAEDAREKADQLPAGAQREDALQKARQADTAAHIDDWINSPGLQPPK